MHTFTIPEPITILAPDGEPAKKQTIQGNRIVAEELEPPTAFLRFLEEVVFADSKMHSDEAGKARGREYVKCVNRVRRALKGKPAGEKVAIDTPDHTIILDVMNHPGTPHPMGLYSQFEPFMEAWESAVAS